MSDRGPEGQDGVEPTEPPTEADLAIILGGDPDAVTTTSHDIIKAGFDDSLDDDADDVALVPSQPIASPRVSESEHVVPSARRRWWFSRHHHHRETDHGKRGHYDETVPSEGVAPPVAAAGSAADPLAWLQSEKKSQPGEAAKPDVKPDVKPEPDVKPDVKPESEAQSPASTAAPAAPATPAAVVPEPTPEAAPNAEPVYETRASRKAKRRE